MKSPIITNLNIKTDEVLENQLMGTIGVHIGQSARIIFNIKQSLYQLVKINVTATAPSRKYDNTPAIVAGSKKNLDDLRRIESMLKGYLNTVKVQEQNSEEDIRANAEKNMARTFSSPFINKLNLQANQTKDKTKQSNTNIEHKSFNSSPDYQPQVGQVMNVLDKLSQSENTNGQARQSYIVEIQNLKDQNNKLKDQINKLNQETKNQIQKAVQQAKFAQIKENEGKTLNNDNTRITDNNAKFEKKAELKKIEQENPLNFQLKIRQNIDQKQSYPQQNQRVQSQKLKHCKSAIFDTSKNLKEIRNRNKQCLDLIRNIKKQIGLQLAQSY